MDSYWLMDFLKMLPKPSDPWKRGMLQVRRIDMPYVEDVDISIDEDEQEVADNEVCTRKMSSPWLQQCHEAWLVGCYEKSPDLTYDMFIFNWSFHRDLVMQGCHDPHGTHTTWFGGASKFSSEISFRFTNFSQNSWKMTSDVGYLLG